MELLKNMPILPKDCNLGRGLAKLPVAPVHKYHSPLAQTLVIASVIPPCKQLRWPKFHHEIIYADRPHCPGPAARYAFSSVALLCVTQTRDHASARDIRLIFCQAPLLLLPSASTLMTSPAVRCPMLPMDIPRPTLAARLRGRRCAAPPSFRPMRPLGSRLVAASRWMR